MLSQINKKIFFEWIAAFILILNSGHYLIMKTNSYIGLVLLLLLCLLLLISTREFKLKINNLLLFLIIGAVFSSVANFTLENLLATGRFCITLLAICYIFTHLLPERVFQKIFKMIEGIIITSILFKVLTLIIDPYIIPTFDEYYNLFILSQRIDGRIVGVFWESGVFSSIIILAFLINILIFEKEATPFQWMIFTIGILATESTAGILLCLTLIFAFSYNNFFQEKSFFFKAILLVSLLIVIFNLQTIFYFLAEFYPKVFHKLIDSELETVQTRLIGPLINLDIFLQNPFFGLGFPGAAALYAQEIGYTSVVAQTSTSTQLLSAIGIIGCLYSLGFLGLLCRSYQITSLSKFILLLIIFAILNKEPHIFNAISLSLLYILSSRYIPVNENEKM